MAKYRKQAHVLYQCTYHIVWVPKYRYRVVTGAIKELVEQDIRMLCSWKDVEVEELNVRANHIHLVASVPPKLSISELMGVVKGKLAIKLFKSYPKMKQKLYWGNHFWARGYFVNTVGVDEDLIRRYVRYQENQERKEEQERGGFELFSEEPP